MDAFTLDEQTYRHGGQANSGLQARAGMNRIGPSNALPVDRLDLRLAPEAISDRERPMQCRLAEDIDILQEQTLDATVAHADTIALRGAGVDHRRQLELIQKRLPVALAILAVEHEAEIAQLARSRPARLDDTLATAGRKAAQGDRHASIVVFEDKVLDLTGAGQADGTVTTLTSLIGDPPARGHGRTRLTGRHFDGDQILPGL